MLPCKANSDINVNKIKCIVHCLMIYVRNYVKLSLELEPDRSSCMKMNILKYSKIIIISI